MEKIEGLRQVEHILNIAWGMIDDAQQIAYKEGMTAVEYRLRSIQMSIEEMTQDIEEKHFAEEEDEDDVEEIPASFLNGL